MHNRENEMKKKKKKKKAGRKSIEFLVWRAANEPPNNLLKLGSSYLVDLLSAAAKYWPVDKASSSKLSLT